MDSEEVGNQLGAMVLQMLHGQVQKTCFKKCFVQPAKFVDALGKSENVCLAKCMDRMYESYSIVTKASSEAAKQLSEETPNQSYSFE